MDSDLEEMEVEKAGGDGDSKSSNKRLSVERIYQKKSQLEHILLRPDTYIGSVEKLTQPMWVYDEEKEVMVTKDVTFVPGLYKIFDEILVNAADNKQRDDKMNTIKININRESNQISVWNNGKGIPVVEHKTEKMYVPTMIFGHLLTSSNYNDFEKKVTGGRNGYGAKLCNIFSTKFTVETCSNEYGKSFRQSWQKNMGSTKAPTLKEASGEDFTCVTFSPDLEKFGMEALDDDIIAIMKRRAYDIAASTKGVRVLLNGKKLPVKNFHDYINLFLKDKYDENDQPLKVVYYDSNPRWQVAVTLSDKGFQQASFVNSIATTKGGRHVDMVADQIVKKLLDIVSKKDKGGIKVKPFQIKNHLWVFVNCLIENPTFDSQTKENMTLQAKSFGSKCTLSEDFMKQASKCGIVESILSWMKFKAQTQLNKKTGAVKLSKLKGIPKLDDANNAGTRNSQTCTLILTEGDSAKSLAVAGLGVIGRDKYGVFPLRGKLLNVREASHKQIMDNTEINNIVKIMGLQFKNKYNDPDDLKTLRYGKLMIMTDQDHDGSHIKGLLVNFIHHFWPNLLKYNVVEQFITPIVKVFKGKFSQAFYSMPEFEEWQKETPNFHTFKVKYYKGLGTSTANEAKEYFTDIDRHRIKFKYSGMDDDASINLAFSKKKIEERKTWLKNFMEDRKKRNELGLPELYLYGKETSRITYNDFINRELILFSEVDNLRSIPSSIDGLKPGQRKVLFTCFKRNINKEIKVAQLAGSVGEISAYHHGEASLMGTIINLAQNFVGSNNLNLLMPQGQFGTRLHGGKDAASPRYIFTYLNPLTRLVFNPLDDPLLKNVYDDNQKVEPQWYIPIIPVVLINGAEGIGTGWSTKIPNFDVREIVANLYRMIEGDEPVKMLPSYKNFKGTIDEISDNVRYIASGEISILDDNSIEISELPIRTWTQSYKEDVLEPMLHGSDKITAMITDYKEYHTESTVRFVIKMTTEKLAQAEAQGLHKVFKIQSNITTQSMVLFDHNGCIRRYESALDILKDFYDLRLKFYVKRKAFMEGMLAAESLKLDNVARFILEKIEGTLVIENKKKKEIISMLTRHGYDSDPIKAWKESISKEVDISDTQETEETEEKEDGPDYNYLLTLQMWHLSKERKDELLKQKEAKAQELSELKAKTPLMLWKIDLEHFLVKLDEREQLERDEALEASKKPTKGGRAKAKVMAVETKPSPHGIRVVPRVDEAFKVKAARADKNKARKEQKELNFNVDDEIKKEPVEAEKKSLAERLNIDKKKIFKKEKESKVQLLSPKSPKSPKKARVSPTKGKKKDPWATDSDGEGSGNESDLHFEDGEGSFIAQNTKERGPRRAAAKKIDYSLDEDDIMEDNVVVSDEEFVPTEATNESGSDFLPSVNNDSAKNGEKVTVEFSDSDDGFDFNSISSKEPEIRTKEMEDAIFNTASSDPPPKPPVEKKKLGPKTNGAEKKKPAAKKPAAEKKKTAAKKVDPKQPSIKSAFSSKTTSSKKTLTISSDEDVLMIDKDDDKPKKAGGKKKRPAISESDSDDDFASRLKKKKSKKAVVTDNDDLDIDLDDIGEAAPKARDGTRMKSKVKYNFSDSDDDF